jgi:lipopolysaccharide export LptBFGC system permease protein LptF
MPELCSEAIPVGVLLAIFWTLSQMGTKNELMAIQVHGISFKSVVFPFFAFGLLLSVFTFFLNDQIIPEFNRQKQQELGNFMSENIGYSTISNKFLPISGNKYFYVKEPIDDTNLDDVLVYEIGNGNLKVIFSDELSLEESEERWKMVNGQVLTMNDQKGMTLNVDFDETDFEELSYELSDSLRDAMSIFNEVDIYGQYDSGEQSKYKYSTTNELIKMVEEPKRRKRALLEINWRLAKSLSPLIIALMGTSISLLSNVKSKSWSIIISFIFIGVFKGSEIFMQSVALLNISDFSNSRYRLDSIIAIWGPNIVFAILGMICFLILDSKLMFFLKERVVRR